MSVWRGCASFVYSTYHYAQSKTCCCKVEYFTGCLEARMVLSHFSVTKFDMVSVSSCTSGPYPPGPLCKVQLIILQCRYSSSFFGYFLRTFSVRIPATFPGQIPCNHPVTLTALPLSTRQPPSASATPARRPRCAWPSRRSSCPRATAPRTRGTPPAARGSARSRSRSATGSTTTLTGAPLSQSVMAPRDLIQVEYCMAEMASFDRNLVSPFVSRRIHERSRISFERSPPA